MLIDYRTRLEMLNLSHNRLNTIQGVSSLQSLIALNLGEQACGILNWCMMLMDDIRWV